MAGRAVRLHAHDMGAAVDVSKTRTASVADLRRSTR